MRTIDMLTDLEIEQIAKEEQIWAVAGTVVPAASDLNYRLVTFAKRLLRQQHNIGKLVNKDNKNVRS